MCIEQCEFTRSGLFVAAGHLLNTPSFRADEGWGVPTLHVECAQRGKEYGIVYRFSSVCEYIYLEYVRAPVKDRVY